jgi:hypothetical protein
MGFDNVFSAAGIDGSTAEGKYQERSKCFKLDNLNLYINTRVRPWYPWPPERYFYCILLYMGKVTAYQKSLFLISDSNVKIPLVTIEIFKDTLPQPGTKPKNSRHTYMKTCLISI